MAQEPDVPGVIPVDQAEFQPTPVATIPRMFYLHMEIYSVDWESGAEETVKPLRSRWFELQDIRAVSHKVSMAVRESIWASAHDLLSQPSR